MTIKSYNDIIIKIVEPIIGSFDTFRTFVDDSFDFTPKGKQNVSTSSSGSTSSGQGNGETTIETRYNDKNVKNPIIILDLDFNGSVL